MRTGWPGSPSPTTRARPGPLIAALLLVTALWAPARIPTSAAAPSVITLTFVRHAEPLANLLGEPVIVLPGLREIEAGVFEGQPESTAAVGYFTAPEQWLRGERTARIPGSIDGDEFDARFDAAVQQIYDSGAVNPVAFAHAASIMLWVMMNVDNPDPDLLLQRPLPNTGRVVLTGNPAAGWTLVEWDGIPVADQPRPT